MFGTGTAFLISFFNFFCHYLLFFLQTCYIFWKMTDLNVFLKQKTNFFIEFSWELNFIDFEIMTLKLFWLSCSYDFEIFSKKELNFLTLPLFVFFSTWYLVIPIKGFGITVDQDVFMQSWLSSSFEWKTWINVILKKVFMGNFLLDAYKIENISFHEMKKLKRYWEICSCSKSISDQTILKAFSLLGGNVERTYVWS